MMKIVYYIASVLGVILFVSSVQFKKKKDILLVQLFSSICYGTAYFLCSAYSGFTTEIIEQVKDFIFYKYENNNKKIPLYFLIIFIIILIFVGMFTYNGIASLCPLFINLAYFISTYMKNPKHIRLVVFFCGFIWAFYNFTVGTYIFIIGNTFEVLSAAVSLWRYHETNK